MFTPCPNPQNKKTTPKTQAFTCPRTPPAPRGLAESLSLCFPAPPPPSTLRHVWGGRRHGVSQIPPRRERSGSESCGRPAAFPCGLKPLTSCHTHSTRCSRHCFRGNELTEQTRSEGAAGVTANAGPAAFAQGQRVFPRGHGVAGGQCPGV